MIQDKFKNLGIGIVELIGIATSFLFITGVVYHYGYYVVGLNAEWIINLLTTKELLISNLRLGASVLIAFMFLNSLFSSEGGRNHLKDLVVGIVMLSGTTVIAYTRERNWVEALGYLLIFISVFGLIYWKTYWKLVCVLIIVFVVPFMNGVTALQYKLKSNLPVVTLKEDQKKWLLFDTFADKFVLIDSIDDYENIRVVTNEDIVNIKSR